MITNRQKEILKFIVEEYVKTVKPVSSSIICKHLNCSSATIRAEMNYLEEIGLLEKTHISSGRVPSEKGYRYYVDELIRDDKLTKKELLELGLNDSTEHEDFMIGTPDLLVTGIKKDKTEVNLFTDGEWTI